MVIKNPPFVKKCSIVKSLLIIIVVILILIAGGYYYFQINKGSVKDVPGLRQVG
jgi:hypothetical protein